MTSSRPNKKALRKQARTARASLTPEYRRFAERQALRRALRAGLFLKGKRWSFYLPVGAEFDVLPLLNQALHMGKDCYLPITAQRIAQPLRFARLDGRHDLTHNRYGIIEPHSRELMNARRLDVMIMPLVGFDNEGRRLGMGGGYYDATLAYLRSRRRWRKPLLVGVAYACQQLQAVPAEPWDVRLDMILTENGLIRF
ncbi:5-formyltetrahydrofolate cyclo-ligase [Betaproteobacteria bacterium SCN2]|jgi:5-formyltetrahydrofolate cyclo-ligase|nr:5-formyltetrahydrofolate cyclo-ligase [Betaproteobacteria bacterium SCN2]